MGQFESAGGRAGTTQYLCLWPRASNSSRCSSRSSWLPRATRKRLPLSSSRQSSQASRSGRGPTVNSRAPVRSRISRKLLPPESAARARHCGGTACAASPSLYLEDLTNSYYLAYVMFSRTAYCATLHLMRKYKVTGGGQVSLPASARNRWKTRSVMVEDLGDQVVIRPLPDDPIAAARGALKGRISSNTLRARARADEARADARR